MYFCMCQHIECISCDIYADSIEANVDAAAVHVDEGTQQLSKASSYQVRVHAACVVCHLRAHMHASLL